MQGTGTRSWLATCIHYWQEPTWIGCLVPSVLPRHLKANCTPCPCLSIFTTLTPLQVWLLQGAETSLDQMSFDQQSRSRVINDLFRTFYWSFNARSEILFFIACLFDVQLNKYWLKVIGFFIGLITNGPSAKVNDSLVSLKSYESFFLLLYFCLCWL